MSPKANKAAKGNKKAVKETPPPKKVPVEEESDSEEESEEETPEPVQKGKKSPAKPQPAAEEESDDSDDAEDDDDDSDEEEGAKATKLYVGGLGKDTGEDEIKKFFKGKKVKVEVEKTPKKPFAYITLKNPALLPKALALSGEKLGGKEIKIEKAKQQQEKKSPAKPAPTKEESSSEDEEEEETKKPANGKKAEEQEDDDDDDEDESDDDEDDSDEEMEVDEEAKAGKKRKAAEQESPAKKAKLDDTVGEDEPTTLFVANLAQDVGEDDIESFFNEKGVKVAEVRRNSKKSFAYVDLKKAKSLEKALALSGEELGGNELTIEKAKPNPKRNQSLTQSPSTPYERKDRSDNDRLTLFVKNISFDAAEEDLEGHFEKATQVRWPKTPDGKKKGFAYIQFDEESHVDEAMSELQGSELCGRSLMLDYVGEKSQGKKGGGDRGSFRSSGEAGKTKTLIVKNLSWNTTEDSLQDAFEGCTSARVVTRDGKSAGFGFVDFPDEESCKSAAESMQNADVDGRNVSVDYAAERGSGGGRGGFRGGRGGFGGRGGGRGGFGGRGGGRGGFGGRGGGRGGFGGGRGRGGGRGGFGGRRDGIKDFKGSKKTFD